MKNYITNYKHFSVKNVNGRYKIKVETYKNNIAKHNIQDRVKWSNDVLYN